jgi:hypothetical protein
MYVKGGKGGKMEEWASFGRVAEIALRRLAPVDPVTLQDKSCYPWPAFGAERFPLITRTDARTLELVIV